jgi:hypothetical protein
MRFQVSAIDLTPVSRHLTTCYRHPAGSVAVALIAYLLQQHELIDPIGLPAHR